MKCSIFDKEFDPYDCIGDITSYDDDSKAERYAEFKPVSYTHLRAHET